MEKIIVNYKTINNEDKRMELYGRTISTQEILYSLMYLHSQGYITLENALPIVEVYDD